MTASEMTDAELFSLFQNQKNKDALETLITRYHQKCFKKINIKVQDEHLSVDLCKKLWVWMLNNPYDIKTCHKFDDYLDTNIDIFLNNNQGIIENIVDSVHLTYKKNSLKPVQAQTATSENVPADIPQRPNSKFKILKNSSARLIWLGLLLYLILTVVVVLTLSRPKLANPNAEVNLYESDTLKVNSVYLAENITTNIDWQYGFVIEGPNSHDAFVAGSYMIDLVNLDKIKHVAEIREILTQLADINSRTLSEEIEDAIENINRNKISDETINILASSFENFYLRNSEQNYFKFGKWVEFNYQHTKLAIELDNTEIYSENFYKDNKFITEFLAGGNHPHLVKDDIEKILKLSTDMNVSTAMLRQQLTLLENLRALLF